MLRRLLIPAALVTLLILVPSKPAIADGLTVYGAKIDAVVRPDCNYSYTMKVENTSQERMDIASEVKGYGISLDRDFVVLDSTEDTSPYSGVGFLTVSPSAFQLAAGGSTDITITASITGEDQEGGIYAIVFIHTLATEGSMSTISGVAARVLLTIQDSKLTHESTISSVDVLGDCSSILVTVQNNGNHHYKPHVRVELVREGTIVGTALVDSDWPLIPGYGRRFAVRLDDLDLPPGVYEARVDVKDDDGNQVARGSSTITLQHVSVSPPVSYPASPSLFQASPADGYTASPDVLPTTLVGDGTRGLGPTTIAALIVGALVLGFLAATIVSKWRSHHE